MKLLGIAAFFLAVFCICTVGDDMSTSTINTTTPAPIPKNVMEAVNATTLQATTLQTSLLTTTETRATNESITSNAPSSSLNVTQQITPGTTAEPPVKTTTTTADKSDSTTNTTQASGTQLTHNESLDASTISLQKNTSAPGTSGLHVSPPTESTTFGSPGSSSGNKNVPGSDIHYSSIILPIVITLIVITLSVFSLVALYRMCQKKTPERQENGTEQAQSDKEGVKLLSVKTTSPETGEHSSQGKNKTRQLFTPQQ